MTGGIVAVIDTNVLVSGVLNVAAKSPPVAIVDGMVDGSIAFLLSKALIAEYRDALLRPAIAKRHGRPEAQIDELLTRVVVNGAVREPEAASIPCPDPDDAHVLALAASEGDVILVTGDLALLEAASPRLRAIFPRDFLTLLRRQ